MNIIVREANLNDKPAIMQFVSKTWSWGDYIPDVWDEWYRDRNGRIFVAEYNGLPVGMNHIRYLEEGVGWLEGVRVHPDFRGRGVATALGEHAMQYGKRLGATKFRLISAVKNIVAHRQIMRMGMKEVCRFSILRCEQDVESVETAARIEDSRQAENLIKHTREYQAMKGFFGDRWAMRSMQEYGFKKLVDEGRVFYLKDGNAYSIAVASMDSFGSEKFGQISFIAGDYGFAIKLARILTRHFFSQGVSLCYMFLPYAHRFLDMAEYHSPEDMILFEL
ncbi:MAG: GNAT family N-acetyltransferase [Conexivisphaerales archaeon]